MNARFDYFIIFAEMRTGSNFLESNLSEFPGLQCHGEAFNPYFIVDPKRRDLFGITLAMREGDPLRLIEVMKEKTSGIPGFRFFHDHDPRVFDAAMADRRCAKIVLTRNIVESYVSRKIAGKTGQWRLGDLKGAKSARIRVDVEEFEKLFHLKKAFQLRIAQGLQTTGQTAFYIDYEDIQDLDVVNGLARYLGETTQLDSFSGAFKKQNPERLADKVTNFEDLKAAIARIDHFDLGRLPNFEPRRGPMVPNYWACASAPVLFMPVKGGPEARVKDWMAAFEGGAAGDLTGGFTQKSLRQWKRQNPGHRSFTVLRHPVRRLHAAFCRHILPDGPDTYLEIRRALGDTYKVPIPDDAASPDYDRRAHRAAFLGFAEFIKGNLSGQTSIRVDGSWASQSTVIQGMAQFMLPDHILREESLESGLRYLAAETGRQAPDLPQDAPETPHGLADIYDDEVEAAVRAAYQRDYMMFGFGPWRE